jgi:mRNA interferase YafQ
MSLYRVRWTNRFRRDLRLCEKRGKDMEKFKEITRLLADGKSLPPRNRNHLLSGNWKGHMECHIESDWLLIYRIFAKDGFLEYVRMGTHADLFE